MGCGPFPSRQSRGCYSEGHACEEPRVVSLRTCVEDGLDLFRISGSDGDRTESGRLASFAECTIAA